MITTQQWQAHRKFHDRLRKERGPASHHPCVDCGKPAQEWSWDNGSSEDYGTKAIGESFDEYSPRCRSCHRIKDGAGWSPSEETRRKMRAAKLGKSQPETQRTARSESMKKFWANPENRAKMLAARQRRGG